MTAALSPAVSHIIRNAKTVKKLEKKSGRRASHKRKRMERLLQEVAPDASGSGCRFSERTRELNSTAISGEIPRRPSAGVESPEAAMPVNPLIPDSDGKLSAPSRSPSHRINPPAGTLSNSGRLVQAQASGSGSAARRWRRMKRIREALQRQQVNSNTPVESPVPHSSREQANPAERQQLTSKSVADSAADAVRQIAESPQGDNDPTAQSMVAIAGAVTALASAIQFRLTDRPEGNEALAQPPSDLAPAALLESREATQKEVVSAEDLPGVAVDGVAVDQGNMQMAPPRQRKGEVSATASQVQPTNDSESNFDGSFFDDDESDVAGAYTVLPPVEGPVESYRDWFLRVVVRNKWMTWFTAFYVHWLILLLMMVVFVHGPERTANLLLNGAFADPPEIETESFDMSVSEPVAEPESQEEAASSEPLAEELTLSEMAEESVAISDSILTEFNEEDSEEAGDVSSQDDAAEQSVKSPPTPARSVSEGSFSVWTEPEYPDAGEPYRIIVQIQLPPKTKSYHLRDLNGVVVGSDGYRKPIPGINPGPLPIVDGCVRLVIPIVSADEQVKDTILIRSKLLKETQKLLIEF